MKHVKLFESFINDSILNENINSVSVVSNEAFGDLVAIETSRDQWNSAGKVYFPQEEIDNMIKALNDLGKPKWQSPVSKNNAYAISIPDKNSWVLVERSSYQEDGSTFWGNSISIIPTRSSREYRDFPKDSSVIKIEVKDVNTLIKKLKSL